MSFSSQSVKALCQSTVWTFETAFCKCISLLPGRRSLLTSFKLPFQILSSSLHWASLLSLSFKGRESESWHRKKADVYICQNITCLIEVGPSCQTLNQKIPRSSVQVDITMEYTQCKGTWKKLKSHCCVSVLPGLTWDECDVLNLISSYLSLHCWDN